MKRRIVEYINEKKSDGVYTLGADIGGTNSNFGIFSQADTTHPRLLFSLHYKSQEITDFIAVLQDVLTYVQQAYGIIITQACFAAAGVISDQKESVKPTNLSFTIYKKEIINNTTLQTVLLVNDFAVIGYGIDVLPSEQLVCINKGTSWRHANKSIIGAGTGLGKCTMIWDYHANSYVPSSSEGGHADCVVASQQEMSLIEHIRKHEPACSNIVSWEDILSGNGIKRIYEFFHHSDGLSYDGSDIVPYPDEIFAAKDRDKSSLETVELYTRFYARCAKNFALDTLALGGIYIAGGIAAKNIPLFKMPLFLQEFRLCNKQAELLYEVPIYIIADYNVSLYGAVRCLYLL